MLTIRVAGVGDDYSNSDGDSRAKDVLKTMDLASRHSLSVRLLLKDSKKNNCKRKNQKTNLQ